MKDLHTAALDMMMDVSNAENEDDQTMRVLRQLKAFRTEVLEAAARAALSERIAEPMRAAISEPTHSGRYNAGINSAVAAIRELEKAP